MSTENLPGPSPLATSEAWSLIPGAVVSHLAVEVKDQTNGQSVLRADSEPHPTTSGTEAVVEPARDRPKREVPDKAIDSLTSAQCLSLLAGQHFGRLAFIDTVGVLPLITPVNYLLDEGSVVFRTDPGSKFTAAILGAPVAFEIDGLDQHNRVGWSVVVRGHAHQITDTTELARLRETPLVPWGPGAKPHYVRVVARQVTGRKISRSNFPSNWLG